MGDEGALYGGDESALNIFFFTSYNFSSTDQSEVAEK